MQYREAASLVLDSTSDPAKTLVLSDDYFPEYFGYYFLETGLYPLNSRGTLNDWAKNRQVIEQSGKEEIWYLCGKLKPEPAYLEALRSEYEWVEENPLFEVEVYHFRIRK